MRGWPLKMLILLLFLSSLSLWAGRGRPGIRVATTTSLYETGLLEYLAERYLEKGGKPVAFLPSGTGTALLSAKRGEADLLLVHAPPLERKFMEEGYGERKVAIAYNFFLIVGPPGDPAGCEDLPPLEALSRIVLAGRGGRARWVSRGDLSGTHIRENLLWREAGFDPEELMMEGWYLEAGAGMGQTLLLASEKGAYTLSDLGTFLKYRKEGLVQLKPMTERGKGLLNVYSAIVVNPRRVKGANFEGAVEFLGFLLSEEGQELIGKFGVEEYGSPLFFPVVGLENSDPELAVWLREVWGEG
ncbi:MAG: substrate-binding domain-containing protein [Candidatus Hadarchaeales archaeon]